MRAISRKGGMAPLETAAIGKTGLRVTTLGLGGAPAVLEIDQAWVVPIGPSHVEFQKPVALGFGFNKLPILPS